MQFNTASWIQYGVDDWLPTFMQQENIPKADFLRAFPKAVGHHYMDCTLDNPCTTVPAISADQDETDIKISLVLSALTHFNDLFRMVNKLYTPDNNNFLLSFQDHFSDTVGSIYYNYSPGDINSTVPADTFAHVLFTPIWYIPNAIPSQPLQQTIDAAIATTAARGFGWEWQDYGAYNAKVGMRNDKYSVYSAFEAWKEQYNIITSGQGNLTLLDFFANGEMLRMSYAEDLVKTGWHKQMWEMYKRLVLSMVMEANNLIIHRASYETMQPTDAAMDLQMWHDDAYTHTISAMIYWGKDDKGNITRQYYPGHPKGSVTFANLSIASRAIYGLSYQCFLDTNPGSPYTTGYNKVWPWQLEAYNQSLYIPDWDGTADDFDAHVPECTYNVPVNDQPADIKQSWFFQQVESLGDGCSFSTKWDQSWFTDPSFPVYRAFMIASDAWVSTEVAVSLADINLALSDLCNASSTALHDWLAGADSEFTSSLEQNLLFSAVFDIGDTINAFRGAYEFTNRLVKGVWNDVFKEGPPVIENVPNPPEADPERVREQEDPENDDGDGNQQGGSGEVNEGKDEKESNELSQPKNNNPGLESDGEPKNLDDLDQEAEDLFKSMQLPENTT